MRCLSFDEPELVTWLRSRLRTATSFTAFTSDADEEGVALLAEPLSDVISRGGSLRLVVPTIRAAAAIRRALDLDASVRLQGFALDVAATMATVNAYVAIDDDGLHCAYLGTSALTEAGLRGTGLGVVMDMRQDHGDARALLDKFTSSTDALLATAVVLTPIGELMQPVVDGLEGREGRREQPPSAPANELQRSGVVGLPTGFVDLDRLTGGLQAGDLWVVTGRSGVGKTMLTLGFARGAAIGGQVGAAVLAGRGTAVDTATMLLSAEARVPLHYLRFGGLGEADWARLARRMGEVAGAPLFLMHAAPEVTGSGPHFSRLAVARDAVARHDLALLVLDDMPAATTPKELLELKALAVRASLCIVAVLDQDEVRALADLESTAMLVADVVLRVDREHDMSPAMDSLRAGEVDLRVLRHRRGPSSVIALAFQGHYGRVSELPPDAPPETVNR